MLSDSTNDINGNAGVQGFVCAPDNVEDVHTQPKLESLLVVLSPTRILPRALEIPGRRCGSAGSCGQGAEDIVQLHVDPVQLLLQIVPLSLARIAFVFPKAVFAKDWLALHRPERHRAFISAIPAGCRVQSWFICKRFFTLAFSKLLKALVAVHGLLPLWQKRNFTRVTTICAGRQMHRGFHDPISITKFASWPLATGTS